MTVIFDHLIVVAGPSGAGKSAFVKQLALGGLSDDITCKLPSGSQSWIQLKTAGSEFWFPYIIAAGRKTPIDGLTLHYDMTRKKLKHMDFKDDPALKLLSLARHITIVNIRTKPQRVHEQLLYREISNPKSPNNLLTRSRRLFAYFLRSSILAMVRGLPTTCAAEHRLITALYYAWNALEPQPKIPSAEKIANITKKVSDYEKEGWSEALEKNWQGYIELLEKNGKQLRQVFIIPAADAQIGMKPNWQIADV